MDQPVNVAQPDVFALCAKLQQQVQAGDPRRPTAGRGDLDILEPLARHMQRVGGRRANHDGGAVLVVMKDRDAHALAAQFFDDETVGRLYVFEVDRAEGRLQRADDIGQFFGICFIQFDIETVDIGEFLEQNRLALHHRFAGQRTDIAQPQNRGAIADHRHQVATCGIAACGRRVVLDLETGLGHAGRIGTGQVAAVGQRLGGADLQFPRARKLVIGQGCLAQIVFLAVVHRGLPLHIV